MKEIRRLNKQEASQKSDIPIKIIKANADIFADYLGEAVNSAVKTFSFSNCLKLNDLHLYMKKLGKTTMKTVVYQHY